MSQANAVQQNVMRLLQWWSKIIYILLLEVAFAVSIFSTILLNFF
jgi:hypothetical protein